MSLHGFRFRLGLVAVTVTDVGLEDRTNVVDVAVNTWEPEGTSDASLKGKSGFCSFESGGARTGGAVHYTITFTLARSYARRIETRVAVYVDPDWIRHGERSRNASSSRADGG